MCGRGDLLLVPINLRMCWEEETECLYSLILYVTGSGKRDIFAHIFKIELLAPRGRVSSQL